MGIGVQELPRSVQQPVQEGDILLLSQDGKLIPDPEEKERRKGAALELLKKLK